eukprot:CAMPEP_0206233594 /NCGR_PEP_ID=MMETSP0047_2-20121206/12095_1 /ASSEMBLY_ACC=CAM_ASM_000192 /TAXON_ID=195065 /ORGANISM="Chroomonas mesostigmatica_cf, Strain CCMP1168" /LENGTH=206 /DNA_ID=CAMNT_0053657533 /DNA_START=18 /DNA_END=635 /DNA_ORIENTATION=-
MTGPHEAARQAPERANAANPHPGLRCGSAAAQARRAATAAEQQGETPPGPVPRRQNGDPAATDTHQSALLHQNVAARPPPAPPSARPRDRARVRVAWRTGRPRSGLGGPENPGQGRGESPLVSAAARDSRLYAGTHAAPRPHVRRPPGAGRRGGGHPWPKHPLPHRLPARGARARAAWGAGAKGAHTYNRARGVAPPPTPPRGGRG